MGVHFVVPNKKNNKSYQKVNIVSTLCYPPVATAKRLVDCGKTLSSDANRKCRYCWHSAFSLIKQDNSPQCFFLNAGTLSSSRLSALLLA